MSKEIDLKTYLLINSHKLKIIVFNENNENLFKEEIVIKKTESINYLDALSFFLKENIFRIEKKLKSFIENVHVILENDDFFSVRSSIKFKSENKKFEVSSINNLLFDLKNEITESLYMSDIIHIKIEKFIIDDIEHSILPEKFDFNYICLEVRFVCLPKTVVKKMNEILGEYQIVMNKIFSYEYLNNLKSNKKESIFKIAENVLNKVNQNEVFLVNKNIKKHGFFEKFFNFFR